MSKLTIAAVAAFLIGAAVASTVSTAQPTFATLVSACKSEATQALEETWRTKPSLRDAIDAHRELMSTACIRWQSAERTEVLLKQCLNQAEDGPRYVGHGRAADPSYVERQKELCRQLAAQRS